MTTNVRTRNSSVAIAVTLALLAATIAVAQIAPQGDPVAARSVGVPDLYIANAHQPLSKLPADLAARLQQQLTTLGISSAFAAYDLRGGLWGTLAPAKPLVPGSGVGNGLTWAGLGRIAPGDDAAYKEAVWQAFRAWLDVNRAVLGVDTSQLGSPSIGTYESGRIVQFTAQRVVDGVAVRSNFVKATLNSGNLVLYGTHNWGTIDVSTAPILSSDQARSVVQAHLSGFTITSWRRPELVLLPMANGAASPANEGRGYRYRLAWAVGPEVRGSLGTWEGLVDAASGQLLAFSDTNEYIDQKKLVGGIFPVSNDGLTPLGIPDGIEQPGFPMSRAYVFDSQGNRLTANSEGLIEVNGEYSTDLTGPFVRIMDNCGIVDESTTCAALDLATSSGTDCTVPAGHSVGDTHSARTGFYELNRLIDQAKSWMGPTANANTPAGWLNRQMPANMNINNACNAFFSPADTSNPTTGSINFYRRTVGNPAPPANTCRNTGEIAAVFDHEWGHGLDTFDNSAGVSLPGEAYADMTAVMRLNQSCIARGFFINNSTNGFCPGNGDPCTECSGVREIDWMKRQSGRPHDLQWVLGQNPTVPGSCGANVVPPTPFNSGPCGKSTHCEGTIIGESMWDLLKRDLPCQGLRWETFAGGAVAGGRCTNGQVRTIDDNSALVLATRLFYVGGGGVVMGYQCDPAVGGCNAGSWYLNILAADDDDGSIGNGTPHMVAINDAFTRHGIACGAPLAMNVGCLATPAPTSRATVSASAGVRSATVSWTPVTGAAEYWVLRTDGVHGCDFGKTRVARIAASAPLTLTQDDLLDGLTYYYSVVGVGGALGAPVDSCAGPMSDCTAVTPLAPGDLAAAAAAVEQGDAAPVVETGDGDPFVDNCETASLTFNVVNTGGVRLTNVKVTGIQPSISETKVLTTLPISVQNIQADCGSPSASAPVTFRFQAGGAPAQSSLSFAVTVTAAELPAAGVTGTLTIHDVETDLTLGNVTYSFENDTQGWELVSGTFNRTDTPPPAADGTFYMKSSSAVDNACDRIRSPELRLTASSTLSLSNQFLTESDALGPYYDRANVGIINEQGQRTLIVPSGGRLYNADDSYTGCNNFGAGLTGWATSVAQPVNTFAQSTWSSAALGAANYAGQEVRIEVSYGTDALTSLDGFQFDQVTVTNVLLKVPDAQSNVCNRPPDAVDDTATTQKNTPVTINVLANDTDPDGDALSVTSVGDPPNGTAVRNANNTVTYTPDAGFLGADSFTYTISDGRGGSDTATVRVTVNAPDLQVTNITVNNNKSVREGDKVTIRATVSNTGSAAAPASQTKFLLDGTTVLGLVATPMIAAGGSTQVSVQWDTRSQKGIHTIQVTADAGTPPTVDESNENNNSSTVTVDVKGNKVKNSSFEQGDSSTTTMQASTSRATASGPAYWSGSSTGAGDATWSDGGSDGNKSAATSGNGGNAASSGSPAWTSDPIAVAPGEALTLVVSVSSVDASSAATAGLAFLGAAGNVLQTVNLITAPLTTSGFSKLEQAVTIPAGVAQVRVKLVGFSPADLRTSGTVKFDEVGLFSN